MVVFRTLGNLLRGAAALWFIGIMVFGLGATYLQHNPESGVAALLGVTAVDPSANPLEQASQLKQGYSEAKETIGQLKELNDPAEAAQARSVAQQWDRDRRDQELEEQLEAAAYDRY